jgi:prepilin-type processing-associated H-X9-DG protein
VQPWALGDGMTPNPVHLRRFALSGATNLGGQSGVPEGAGGCNEWGADSFNGGVWQQVTIVLQWAAGTANFLAFDGHVPQAELLGSAARLLASWSFPHPELVRARAWTRARARARARAPPTRP